MTSDERFLDDLRATSSLSREGLRSVEATISSLVPSGDRPSHAVLPAVYSARIASSVAGVCLLVLLAAVYGTPLLMSVTHTSMTEHGSVVAEFYLRSDSHQFMRVIALPVLLYVVTWSLSIILLTRRVEARRTFNIPRAVDRLSLVVTVAAPVALIAIFSILRFSFGDVRALMLYLNLDEPSMTRGAWMDLEYIAVVGDLRAYRQFALACMSAVVPLTVVGAVLVARWRIARWTSAMALYVLLGVVVAALEAGGFNSSLRDPNYGARATLVCVGVAALLVLLAAHMQRVRDRESALATVSGGRDA